MNTMWCKHCQQDVPGLPAPEDKTHCCARCGTVLNADPGTRPDSVPTDSGQPRADAPEGGSELPPYDGWELDEQLRHIERVLAIDEPSGGPVQAAYRREITRLDPPHSGPSQWHPLLAEQLAREGSPRRWSALGALAWTALSLGTTALFCGGILLAWSSFTERPELWGVGLPIAIGGQIALLIGLILQIDRIWNDSRRTSDKLRSVDEQLRKMQTSAEMPATGGDASGGFQYAHPGQTAAGHPLLPELPISLDLPVSPDPTARTPSDESRCRREAAWSD